MKNDAQKKSCGNGAATRIFNGMRFRGALAWSLCLGIALGFFVSPRASAQEFTGTFAPRSSSENPNAADVVEVVEAAPSDTPPGARFVVRTADGLPLEADILELFTDKIRVRVVVSGRVIFVPCAMQSEELLKQLQSQAERIQKTVKNAKFRIAIAENSSRDKPASQAQGVAVISSDTVPAPPRSSFPSAQPNAGGAPPPAVRTLYPGARCLRIHTPLNLGVPLPADVTVYWYARVTGKDATGMEFKESARIEFQPTGKSDYLSQPPPFPRTAYQGYAVIITNPANNVILWREATLPSYLEDAEVRHGLRKPAPVTTPPPSKSGKR